jgi:hypothetical protein
MRAHQLNAVSSRVAIGLSLTALMLVVIGFTQPPQRDEGTLAHLFQLSVALLLPTLLIYLASADWKQPARSARPLAFPAIALVLAFGALYYLEHYR